VDAGSPDQAVQLRRPAQVLQAQIDAAGERDEQPALGQADDDAALTAGQP